MIDRLWMMSQPAPMRLARISSGGMVNAPGWFVGVSPGGGGAGRWGACALSRNAAEGALDWPLIESQPRAADRPQGQPLLRTWRPSTRNRRLLVSRRRRVLAAGDRRAASPDRCRKPRGSARHDRRKRPPTAVEHASMSGTPGSARRGSGPPLTLSRHATCDATRAPANPSGRLGTDASPCPIAGNRPQNPHFVLPWHRGCAPPTGRPQPPRWLLY
jgi:hypothetical protein